MENSLKILVVTNTYPTEERPGDTPNIKDQINDLEELGVSVDIFHIDHQRKINYLWGILKIFLLSFQRKHYDLIHAFYGHSGLIAKLQFKYPVIITFLGSDLLGEKDGKIGKFIVKYADGVIVMTDEMKMASDRMDARVIPFDADTNTFSPTPMNEARTDLGLPPEKKLILFPWNPARPEKQFHIASEAIEIAKKEIDIELLPVFDQPREIIAKYMSACDAMILTSHHEGSPLAVREAMVCHLPVISVDVGDVREILEKHDGGIIVEDAPSKIAAKLKMAVRNRDKFFSTSSKNLNTQSAAKKVLELYQYVLGY